MIALFLTLKQFRHAMHIIVDNMVQVVLSLILACCLCEGGMTFASISRHTMLVAVADTKYARHWVACGVCVLKAAHVGCVHRLQCNNA